MVCYKIIPATDYAMNFIKGYVRYIFVVFIKSERSIFLKLGKMCFIWLQKIVSFSRYTNFKIPMTSPSAQERNKKCILLRGDNNLVMKCGHFM